MNTLLIVFCVLVVVFLAVIAIIYVVRPTCFIDNDEANPDIDFWLTVNFAIACATIAVGIVGILWYFTCDSRYHTPCTLREFLTFHSTKCVRP